MILIVDDNRENIYSLRSLLELHNFPVDTADSGHEALKKILKNQYSLIILDVQMPDMDGFEVAEATTGYSKSKDIPIIFLSAVNTHKKFVTKGYVSGGIDYVTKPFDPEILLLKVKTFYRLSEQTRRLNALEKELRAEIELRKQAESALEVKVLERTKELRSANQRLEESNRQLQQFAYIASHDLQEPLRKIQTFGNLILDRYSDDGEKVKSYVARMSESAGRLRKLVSDLLEYSKIYFDDRFNQINLNALIDEVSSDLEVQIRQSDCNIVVAPLPVIEGVPSLLRQLFQNLISNSLKFAKKDSDARIEISGERVERRDLNAPSKENGDYCRIVVRDNGIGFNAAYKEIIFEIFQRLNDRSTYEGTGIGLAIVKKVVDRHNGLITATGEVDRGATFTMILPVRQFVPYK